MRFNDGDKVVCVNDDDRWLIYKNSFYIICNADGGSSDVSLKGLENIYYRNDRFISLKEYREKKLKRILENG